LIKKELGRKACLRVALPVAAFLEMLTKSVNLRATAATRTGCVRHGVGHQTPSQGAAAEMLPKAYDPTYSSWTLRGLLQTRSLSLSS